MPHPTRPQLFADTSDDGEPPEWRSVQAALDTSHSEQAVQWEAMARCVAVEAYTDGSAPLHNPGGPAGFAAVLVGFAALLPGESLERPEPAAYLYLGGYVAARREPPATSNNRAEIAGVLAALAALRDLGATGLAGKQVRVWSDSSYVVNCGTGLWQRKKNTDLWPFYDSLQAELRAHWPGGITPAWVKGHAGNRFNDAADQLATQAAFNFDDAAYSRYRAAQLATGLEMPGAAALAGSGEPVKIAIPAQVPVASDIPPDWLTDADYTLVVLGRPGGGRYHLAARDGRTRAGQMNHPNAEAAVAEYLTVIAALRELAERIAEAGRDPAAYRLLIYGAQELVVKQLTGQYRVKAPALAAPYAAAREAMARFKAVDVRWKPALEVKSVFGK